MTATVLVPWQLGRAALRDRLFRSQSRDVFDTSFRGLGDYFLSDFLAGAAVMALVAGAVLVLLNIRGSRAWVVVGVLVVSVGAVLIPTSTSKWTVAETRTVAKLAEGPPASVDECTTEYNWTTSDFASFVETDGLRHVWRPIVIDDAPETRPECTKVAIYNGARRIATSEAIRDVWSGSIALWKGDEPANSYLAYAVSASSEQETPGQIGVVRLSDGRVMWTKQVGQLGSGYSDQSGPALAVVAGTLVVKHVVDGGFGADETGIVGYDLETGKRGWKPSCPRGFPAVGLFPSDDETIGAVLHCRSDNQTGTYNVDRVDGTLRPYDN